MFLTPIERFQQLLSLFQRSCSIRLSPSLTIVDPRLHQSHLYPSSMSSKRQTSLAGFFSPKAAVKKARKASEAEIVCIEDDEDGLAPPLPKKAKRADDSSLASILNKGLTEPQAGSIAETKDENVFVNYPPANHASYHSPPIPDFNHPIPISPPPTSLTSTLRFNTIPKVITSPADLDLLFFNRFIDPSSARKLTNYLLDAMPWYRVNYTTRMGMDIKTPRYTTVFGKDSTALPWDQYVKWKPRAIPEMLLRLMQKGEDIHYIRLQTCTDYNSRRSDRRDLQLRSGELLRIRCRLYLISFRFRTLPRSKSLYSIHIPRRSTRLLPPPCRL